MTLLQYFVFDETGNHLLEANAYKCSNKQNANALASVIVDTYKSDPQFKDLNLLLSCGNKVLFDSKAK